MEFESLQYSREQVDHAGRDLLDPSDEAFGRAIPVLMNWRAAHNWPLDVITDKLREATKLVDRDAIISSRIKRLPAIMHKLRRMGGRGITLTNMQDIGGCRAVLNSVDDISRTAALCKEAAFEHKFLKEDDYITTPKPTSGYRSHHLIYAFQTSDPKESSYAGMRTEIQIRSRLQHAWAAAVETVDRFKKFSLKTGYGPDEWNEFFRHMSTVIALKEGKQTVRNTPIEVRELKRTIQKYGEKLEVLKCLRSYSSVIEGGLKSQPSKEHYCYVISVWPLTGKSANMPFDVHHIGEAYQYYSEHEQLDRNTGGDTVLVFVDDFYELKEAYPSYYGDTEIFQQILLDAIAT